MFIYLAGNIWKEEDKNIILKKLSPEPIQFLHSDVCFSTFGRDLLSVHCSDALLVNAKETNDLAVGAEMMWAKMHYIPLITIASKADLHQKPSALVIESLSDEIVEDVKAAAKWLNQFITGDIEEIKGPEYMYEGMRHYLTDQLPKDLPMKKLAESSEVFKERLSHSAYSSNPLF